MRKLTPLLIIALILAFIYFFPRFLLNLWGPSDPWTNYFYQYGLGSVTFFIGIYLILHLGACKPGRGRDTMWLVMLFIGLLLYAGTHAIWIIAAQSYPYLGGN